MRVEAQILQSLARAGDETAERTEGFGEGAIDKRNLILNSKSFCRAAAVLPTGENRMRFIDENTRTMRRSDWEQFGQVSEIAVHRIDAFEHHELTFAVVSA